VENGKVKDLRAAEAYSIQIRIFMKESGNKTLLGASVL